MDMRWFFQAYSTIRPSAYLIAKLFSALAFTGIDCKGFRFLLVGWGKLENSATALGSPAVHWCCLS
jgi:hypothetical protein